MKFPTVAFLSALIASKVTKADNALRRTTKSSKKNFSEQFDADCIHFSFEVTLDAFPADFKIALDSEEMPIWDIQAHNYGPSQAYTKQSDKVCIDPTGCYLVSIFDSPTFSDGMTKVEEPGKQPGKFKLKYGKDTIGTYDGMSDGCYETKWYRFGACEYGNDSGMTGICGDKLDNATYEEPSEPDEIGAEQDFPEVVDLPVQEPVYGIVESPESKKKDDDPKSCEMLVFTILLDQYPEDVRYTLEDVATGTFLWDRDPFPPSLLHTEQTDEVCIDPNGCYKFTVYDSDMFPMGLTEPEEGQEMGMFAVQFAGAIGKYSAVQDGCYRSRWYQLGEGCLYAEGADPVDGSCP